MHVPLFRIVFAGIAALCVFTACEHKVDCGEVDKGSTADGALAVGESEAAAEARAKGDRAIAALDVDGGLLFDVDAGGDVGADGGVLRAVTGWSSDAGVVVSLDEGDDYCVANARCTVVRRESADMVYIRWVRPASAGVYALAALQGAICERPLYPDPNDPGSANGTCTPLDGTLTVHATSASSCNKGTATCGHLDADLALAATPPAAPGPGPFASGSAHITSDSTYVPFPPKCTTGGLGSGAPFGGNM